MVVALRLEGKRAIAKVQSLLLRVEEWVGVIKKMPRLCKQRRVFGKPNSFYFKPAGVRMSELDESNLSISEFEAIRLIDFKEISQGEAAIQMHISQPTFSRVLKSGRKK